MNNLRFEDYIYDKITLLCSESKKILQQPHNYWEEKAESCFGIFESSSLGHLRGECYRICIRSKSRFWGSI